MQYTSSNVSKDFLQEDRENEKILAECIQKLFQIVIQSRVNLDKGEFADQINKWFNIELADHVHIRNEILSLLSKDIHSMFQLDILVRAPTLGNDVLLERWSVRYEVHQSMTKKYNRSNMYKRLIILIRSLYSFTRMLPGQQLVRTSHAAFHNIEQEVDYQLYYRISTSVASTNFDTPPSNFVFSPIVTSSGILHVSVFYRKNTDFQFNKKKPTQIPHNIIHDYIPQQASTQQQNRRNSGSVRYTSTNQQKSKQRPRRMTLPTNLNQNQNPHPYSQPVEIPVNKSTNSARYGNHSRHSYQGSRFSSPTSSPGGLNDSHDISPYNSDHHTIHPHSMPVDLGRQAYTASASAFTKSYNSNINIMNNNNNQSVKNNHHRIRSSSDRAGAHEIAMNFQKVKVGTPPPHPSRPSFINYPPPNLEINPKGVKIPTRNARHSRDSIGDFSKSPPFAGSYTASTSLQNMQWLSPKSISPIPKQPMAVGSLESKSSFSDSDTERTTNQLHQQQQQQPLTNQLKQQQQSFTQQQQQPQQQQQQVLTQLKQQPSSEQSRYANQQLKNVFKLSTNPNSSGSSGGMGMGIGTESSSMSEIIGSSSGGSNQIPASIFAFPDDMDFVPAEEGEDVEAEVGSFIRQLECAPELTLFKNRTTNEAILLEKIIKLQTLKIN